MKAYLILDIEVQDLNLFRSYVSEIPAFVKKHSGQYIVQSVEAEAIEGDWKPQRVVVIEFPSRENAQEFLKDPDAKPLFSIRHKSTVSKLILVDGFVS